MSLEKCLFYREIGENDEITVALKMINTKKEKMRLMKMMIMKKITLVYNF